jgi:hypothetical protein
VNKTRLGCLSGTGIFAVIITLLFISGISIAQGGVLFSPGKLNAQPGKHPLGGVLSHADTGGKCSACHAAIWVRTNMAERCLTCHATLLQNNQSFHAVMLAQSKEITCRHCHTDHNGGNASLTLINLENFPHNTVGFSLQAHQKMADGTAFVCSDCHGDKITSFNPAACEACHRQLDDAFVQSHIANFGQNCLSCHDGIDSNGRTFDHNQQSFPLSGKHAALSCDQCHQAARSIADLRAAPQDCYACHARDDSHNGQLGQDCAACHKTDEWGQAAFDHTQTAFPLDGAHSRVECMQCHANNIFKGTPQDCSACHAKDDVHNGKFGQNCTACHSAAGWNDVVFDHSLSSFPLTGAHTTLRCEQCHLNNVFKGTPQDCSACHMQDDVHNGQFGNNCAACHSTDSWKSATFDHSLSAFPLTGAHINVQCEQCHTNKAFKGTPAQCASCHADPAFHQGLFGSDCEACHKTNAWSPAQFNGRHTFPINHGNRGSTACSVCHPGSLTAYTCYGCHEHNAANTASKHREEHISNINNCVRCHPTGRGEGEGGGDEHEGGGDD